MPVRGRDLEGIISLLTVSGDLGIGEPFELGENEDHPVSKPEFLQFPSRRRKMSFPADRQPLCVFLPAMTGSSGRVSSRFFPRAFKASLHAMR